MGLFSWFSKGKPAEVRNPGRRNSDALNIDPRSRQHPSEASAKRKSERMERRELLYSTIRQSMLQSGVLSSSYKFKVLSLDSRGKQYMVMVDLKELDGIDTKRHAEIEQLIMKNAITRHEVIVTAVYWRIHESHAGGFTKAQVMAQKPRFDPLQHDEMLAFKDALASTHTPLASPGEIIQSGPRNPNRPLPTGFEDTERDERNAPLSGTQYGDLV